MYVSYTKKCLRIKDLNIRIFRHFIYFLMNYCLVKKRQLSYKPPFYKKSVHILYPGQNRKFHDLEKYYIIYIYISRSRTGHGHVVCFNCTHALQNHGVLTDFSKTSSGIWSQNWWYHPKQSGFVFSPVHITIRLLKWIIL